jgi:two-component system phosphate regulon sensor histidine kinase PhoR
MRHELRSLLTVIMGYLIPRRRRPHSGELRQLVSVMQISQSVRRLVEDSAVIKLESGQSVSRGNVVDVANIVSTAMKEAFALPEHPGTIEIKLDSSANLLGEETELQSVVSNLVANAVRYTPADGAVTISWSVDADGGHLAVQDTGIGISEDDIPRVTERFYRTDGGRTRQRGGTGLGLAIVKHALRRHDAELEIHSSLGQGSTFVCHFPRDRLALS